MNSILKNLNKNTKIDRDRLNLGLKLGLFGVCLMGIGLLIMSIFIILLIVFLAIGVM